MPFSRGDIINIFFELPNYKKQEWHPALIISNDEVFLDDNCYIVLMITGSEEFNDKFSFLIEDKMLNKPLDKKSQVRCHLVTYVLEKHLTGSRIKATMKEDYVDAVVNRMVNSALLP